MPPGLNSLVARPRRQDQGHGQVGYFAGADQVGCGAVGAAPR